MYAVIEDSGTQIKVSEGDVIKVARREVAEDVATLTFDRVLLISDEDGAEGDGGSSVRIGQPTLEGAKVTADILGEGRTPRVPVVKFKRRKNYLRRKSHRQPYIEVRVTAIQG